MNERRPGRKPSVEQDPLRQTFYFFNATSKQLAMFRTNPDSPRPQDKRPILYRYLQDSPNWTQTNKQHAHELSKQGYLHVGRKKLIGQFAGE